MGNAVLATTALAASVVSDLQKRWASDAPPTDSHREVSIPLAHTPDGPPMPRGRSNPYWDVVRWIPVDAFKTGRASAKINGNWGLDNGLYGCSRDALARVYTFAIPSPTDVTFLFRQLAGRPVLELGAGTGYWAWQLAQAGIDVYAVDSGQWIEGGHLSPVHYHPVHTGSIEQIVQHPHRVLMLCWPDQRAPFAAEAVRAYSGDELIYIGESADGCTADDDFYDLLSSGWELVATSDGHVNFTGLYSEVNYYRRKHGC